MPDNGAEFLVWLIGTAIPVVGMYVTNKGKIKEAEHRQTVLEMTVKHLAEKAEHNARRLDEHEEQNRITLKLVENVKTLTEQVGEIRLDIKEIKKGGLL